MIKYDILKHTCSLYLEYNFMIYIDVHISLHRMTELLNIDLLYL